MVRLSGVGHQIEPVAARRGIYGARRRRGLAPAHLGGGGVAAGPVPRPGHRRPGARGGAPRVRGRRRVRLAGRPRRAPLRAGLPVGRPRRRRSLVVVRPRARQHARRQPAADRDRVEPGRPGGLATDPHPAAARCCAGSRSGGPTRSSSPSLAARLAVVPQPAVPPHPWAWSTRCVLFAVFGAYSVRLAAAPTAEPELEGVAAWLGHAVDGGPHAWPATAMVVARPWP